MTDIERSEQVAKVMERVCDLCVHPVQATDQDELYDICESCQVTATLWDALRNAENQTIDEMARGIAKAVKQILVNQERGKTMNMFYRLYEQSQDATMEQVRDYAAKTGEEIRLQISRPTPTGTVSIYLVYDRLFCVKEEQPDD